ncbi:MAG: ribonuclease P protein component [Pseudomonadota bacterium]
MNGPYLFTRQLRLLKAQDYKYVFERPAKSTDPYLTVLARPNGRDFARLGLAISKKRLKRAVDRNRLKRLIRESFRHHQSHLAGLDCVVLAKNGVAQVNNHTLLLSLARHWQQLSHRCKKS